MEEKICEEASLVFLDNKTDGSTQHLLPSKSINKPVICHTIPVICSDFEPTLIECKSNLQYRYIHSNSH